MPWVLSCAVAIFTHSCYHATKAKVTWWSYYLTNKSGRCGDGTHRARLLTTATADGGAAAGGRPDRYDSLTERQKQHQAIHSLGQFLQEQDALCSFPLQILTITTVVLFHCYTCELGGMHLIICTSRECVTALSRWNHISDGYILSHIPKPACVYPWINPHSNENMVWDFDLCDLK